MAYNDATFMTPLVCAPCVHTTEEEESGKQSATSNYVWVMVWSSKGLSPPQSSIQGRMADHGSTLNDGAIATKMEEDLGGEATQVVQIRLQRRRVRGLGKKLIKVNVSSTWKLLRLSGGLCSVLRGRWRLR